MPKFVVQRNQFQFIRDNIGWHTQGYHGCCGSQIIYGFRSNLWGYHGKVKDFPDLDNIPTAVLKQLRSSLSSSPQTTAITQEAARSGGQYVANKVLPQIGFEKVSSFKGRSGARLALWVYVTPNKRIKVPQA